MTLIQNLGEYQGNNLWIKREDLIPFSFGGNKARKAQLFFREIEKGNYDCVVTYGSGSSNHCRVVSNECYRRGIGCYIISPKEASEPSFNSLMMTLLGAEITVVSLNHVHSTIEDKIAQLKEDGKKPYLIEGGGHGYLGTEAYVQCYKEIRDYEKAEGIHFDYIFFASGTGTTQAGLVCGQLIYGDDRKIVGISIARKNPRGRDIVLNSVRDYIDDKEKEEKIQTATVFVDDYTTGYGENNDQVFKTIEFAFKTYGIPLDATYTGKAFWGMTEQLKGIRGKNVLFIHTGGTPLFFDALNKIITY